MGAGASGGEQAQSALSENSAIKRPSSAGKCKARVALIEAPAGLRSCRSVSTYSGCGLACHIVTSRHAVIAARGGPIASSGGLGRHK
jgi:hypothetical protein